MTRESRTRRIALISEHASPMAVQGGVDAGGQNVYVAQLASRLGMRGHQVDVFTRRDDPELPQICDMGPYRLIHVDAGPPEYIRKEELLPWMPEFTEQTAIFMMEQAGEYDIVHANFWMSGMTAAELKRRFDIPFVITFHALGKVRRRYQGTNDQFPDDRFAIEERLVAEADRVIAECPQDELDLLSLYRADPSRLAMVPCGFDPHECEAVDQREARDHLGLPQDVPIVLQLGRLVPRKGVDNVVRAFSCLRRDFPDAQLVIVGGESEDPDPALTPEIARLTALAAEEGVLDGVRFEGRRPRGELRYYYSAADVFATTPWYEPFGITPVEAMACGTPVVGSRVGGIQYTVLDGSTGLLVPPQDPAALANALATLLGDEGLRRRMGASGTRRARELFTWDGVVDSLASLYEEVIAERLARRRDDWERHAIVSHGFDGLLSAVSESRRRLQDDIVLMGKLLSNCFQRGGKLLVCGNGGSAADAQHLAGELVARFRSEHRRALPVICFPSDIASLTAWANDVGYDSVFAREVEAFGEPGDVLLGISTSGCSANVVQAFEVAQRRGIQTLALLGRDGGDLLSLATSAIVVPSTDTQRIQEVHGLLVHLLCELVEFDFLANNVDLELEAAG